MTRNNIITSTMKKQYVSFYLSITQHPVKKRLFPLMFVCDECFENMILIHMHQWNVFIGNTCLSAAWHVCLENFNYSENDPSPSWCYSCLDEFIIGLSTPLLSIKSLCYRFDWAIVRLGWYCAPFVDEIEDLWA